MLSSFPGEVNLELLREDSPSESVTVLLSSALALLQQKKDITPTSFSEIDWEGRTQEGSCLCQGEKRAVAN